MNDKIDVLAVMDKQIDRITKGGFDGDEPDMRRARAAIAELIERAQALSDSITFRIDDPRCELHCKLVDSLAIVGGAE